MKQITEDYVSYETSVLLKEKGFDGDRDINAAKNILEEGLRISAGTVDYTEGDEVRLARKHLSKKSEINKSLHC